MKPSLMYLFIETIAYYGCIQPTEAKQNNANSLLYSTSLTNDKLYFTNTNTKFST